MLPRFLVRRQANRLGVGPIVATVWKFFVASAVAGCGAALLVHIMPPFATTPGALGALLRLVSVSILFFALYLGAVISLHRGLGPINQTVLLLRDLRPQRKREDSVPAVEIPAAAVVPAGLEDRD